MFHISQRERAGRCPIPRTVPVSRLRPTAKCERSGRDTDRCVAGRVYRAAPPLDDGAGDPPPGWDNPTQQGTMIVRPDCTATLTDGDLRGEFVLMTNAPRWSRLCN